MYISAGPFRGHQAVKNGFEVYNSIASIDRLQTSKYIALLTSMFTASLSASSLPVTCFYVVIGQLDEHFTLPKPYSLRLWSPLESLKNPSIIRYSFHRFLTPKSLSKRSQNHHKTEFQSSSESHSVFLSFWHPKWSPPTTKTAILFQ